MGDSTRASTWTPWRSVVAFGLVSLTTDMVYEGMRSIAGPFLGTLGASALTVGVVTGAGEAIALALRLVTGPLADRTSRHWALTIVGYALTAVCVPLLAVTPFLGASGLAVASALILAERIGKAVRSPSKSALLAGMAAPVGRGRGFGVHKALDQIGAFAGPLVIAGVAFVTGRIWVGFLVLALPGAVSLVLLLQLRRHSSPETGNASTTDAPTESGGSRLPLEFYLFAASCAAATVGLMTFGVISFAAVSAGLVSAAVVPLLYAGAMAVGAVSALTTGFLYDRIGARVLYALPVLVAGVPALVFRPHLAAVVIGLSLWGMAAGVQDSTVKALVADLVPRRSLATAYGLFAAAQGAAALAGGVLAGALYGNHLRLLISVIGVMQAVSLALLFAALRRRPSREHVGENTS